MRLNIEILNFRAELGALMKTELPVEELVVKLRKKRRKKRKKRKVKVIKKPVRSTWPRARKWNKEWFDYKELVWSITEAQDLKKLEHFEKRAFRGYHLDHKVSIWYGFKNKLDPKLIGSLNNLEFIPHSENNRKGIRCNFKNSKCLQAVLFY